MPATMTITTAEMMMAVIGAGAGLTWVRSLRLPTKLATQFKATIFTKNVGSISCVILISITLAMSIPFHMNTKYYHMIDSRDYKAFVWIKENVGDRYDRAILDPWKATAFTAVTEKKTYTRIHAFPQTRDKIAYEFLEGGCANTTFLRENDISIVYTSFKCLNTDLEEVRKDIYLLKEGHESE